MTAAAPEPTELKVAPAPAAPLSANPAAAERTDGIATLDGRQIFFLFVGSALAACLIFALGVAVGRRVEQRAAAREKAAPADPLAVLDEIANAEESLTFHRAVLDRPPPEPAHAPGAATERPVRYSLNSATFVQRLAAEELLRRLRETGYKVKVVDSALPGQKPLYRLQIGDFPSPESAQPIRSDLLSRLGLATTVAKIPTAPALAD